jgi:hypothetical protein
VKRNPAKRRQYQEKVAEWVKLANRSLDGLCTPEEQEKLRRLGRELTKIEGELSEEEHMALFHKAPGVRALFQRYVTQVHAYEP